MLMKACYEALPFFQRYQNKTYLYKQLPYLSAGAMILVYCPKITSRISYMMGLMLETHLGIEWNITSDAEFYESFQGARLNYGGKPSGRDEVWVDAAGLLTERGIRYFQPDLLVADDKLPLLFPTGKQLASLPFDPFAAAFYLLSRYEEYLPFQKDSHGRYEARESFSFKKGFLQIPVVDHYAIMLRKVLAGKFPDLSFQKRKFSFIPTYDIDVAYAYRGRGVVRTMAGIFRQLMERDFQGISERFRVLTGKENDPFDTYDKQLEWHHKYGLKAFYFFLCGDYGSRDKNIAFFSATFQKLIKRMGDYAFIGLHPSYASHLEPKQLEIEKKRLSNILNRQVRFSRQHYLMLAVPRTYQELLSQDIDNDFSMGYASQPGFRAGTCTPFYFYDLDRETPTNLRVFPFTVMDGTLRQYLGLSPAEAIACIKTLAEAVRRVDGTFISLWHNDSLAGWGKWKDWPAVYEELLKEVTK
jgi:hypothetical protein